MTWRELWEMIASGERKNSTVNKWSSTEQASNETVYVAKKILEVPFCKSRRKLTVIPWTINVEQHWIKQDSNQSKKIKIELKSKRLLQRLIKQCEKDWGKQYFDWPILVFIRFIRKNLEHTEYIYVYCKMYWSAKHFVERKFSQTKY